MDKLKELTDLIRSEIKELTAIEVGQIFNSKIYGNIVATRIEQHTANTYSIYGFDVKEGLPRNNYYPRDLELVGKEIMLNNVLYWHSLNGRNKYSHFDVSYGEGYFMIYDGKKNGSLLWDFSKPYLKDQSEELIKFLCDLANLK